MRCPWLQAGMGTAQDCSVVLSADTLPLLGSGPACRFTSPGQLQVRPGLHRCAGMLPGPVLGCDLAGMVRSIPAGCGPSPAHA